MLKFKMLFLTDHSNHSSENSLYALAQAMRVHPRCGQLDIATRKNDLNNSFFKEHIDAGLFVSEINENFSFSKEGLSFKENIRQISPQDYDAIWLRMPPPLSPSFLSFLNTAFENKIIINDPKGIEVAGSKKFLINFPELCPPIQICETVESIIEFKNRFPIVLKPYQEYGGRGIVRIDGNQVWEGAEETTFDDFIHKIQDSKIAYLGVKFLKNVSEGDKRIVVINGEIMGASLRLPAENSWLCNVAMGGTSHFTEADEDEIRIVNQINPTLSKMGIVMYGVDTLQGDDGKRVLSEINTTSIGGLPQIAKLTGKPLVEKATNLIWDYISEKIKKDV